jgi:hypothetical protein
MAGKSNFQEWRIQLVDGRTMKPIDDDAATYVVLTENSAVKATLYSDGQGTSLSQTSGLTTTDGVMRFWTASTVTAVDITILTAQSHSFFLESLSVSDAHVTVWPETCGLYNLIIPYLVVGASEAIVDTGFDILAKMLIKDCFIHVTTVGTGAALDIGTSTDSDGFADGVSVATTGMPISLLEEALVSGSSLLGALIAYTTSGALRRLHRRANATSGANIVYTNTTSSSTAGSGYIYLTYQRIPSGDG